MDAELGRRNLTTSDEAAYQQVLKHNGRREAKRRRKKIFGTRRDVSSWVEFFWGLLIIGLISFAYLALPSRFHMKPIWQETAVHVIFASVFIAVFSKSLLGKFRFWMSLMLSSAAHAMIVHAWLKRVGEFSRGQGKLAVLLGFVLFFAVYGLVWVLRRNFYGEEAHEHA